MRGQESIFDLFMKGDACFFDETVNSSHELCLVDVKQPQLKKK